MRVLHVINGQYYSGAERVQDLLAERLPELGFEVGFACVKPDRFPAARHSQQAPLYVVPMCSRLDLRAAWRIAKIVRREGYAILHAHTPRSALVAGLAARWAGVPWFYHVHSPTARDSARRRQDRLNALVERWSPRSAARLIAVSESLGRQMQQQAISQDRIRVVHNGVPCLASVPRRDPPAGTWTLGTVALFRPRKGVEVLLKALALLVRQGLGVRLRAVGPFETPQYEQSLKTLARELDVDDRIEWTGFSADVTAELMRMDLFVLPSLFGEGLPMVVLEAMSAGLPVVATCVEGVPEAIRDRQDGLLVEPGDPEAMARAVAEVIDGRVDWPALRASAMARQAAEFSDRSMAAGVARVYRELLRD